MLQTVSCEVGFVCQYLPPNIHTHIFFSCWNFGNLGSGAIWNVASVCKVLSVCSDTFLLSWLRICFILLSVGIYFVKWN